MSLEKSPALKSFFSTCIIESEAENDEAAARAYLNTASTDRIQKIINEAESFLANDIFLLEELGSEANRWFANEVEAKAWLKSIVRVLREIEGKSSASALVKDSNGTVLSEGDSVVVIKDLKVKGGSSDLKRGTLIKKIHLVEDSEVIECRVDGSTLVLKTIFLKKA